jgi:hypothetical protein
LLAIILEVFAEAFLMVCEKLLNLWSSHENVEVSSELALSMTFVLLPLMVDYSLQRGLFLLLEDGSLLFLQSLSLSLVARGFELAVELLVLLDKEVFLLLCLFDLE